MVEVAVLVGGMVAAAAAVVVSCRTVPWELLGHRPGVAARLSRWRVTAALVLGTALVLEVVF